MEVTNKVNPSPQRQASFFGGEEDGPFVMINLLKFKEKAEYPDGSDADLSGAEAYARYGIAVVKCLTNVGGKPLYSGAVTGLMIGEVEDNWDMVALAQYPSLEAFRNMVMSDEYQAAAVHRLAGLAGQVNIKTKPMTG